MGGGLQVPALHTAGGEPGSIALSRQQPVVLGVVLTTGGALRAALCAQADCKTQRFKALVEGKGGRWRDIFGVDEKRVAELVREDGVDILMELTGHTANNRLGVLACHPAPVQV